MVLLTLLDGSELIAADRTVAEGGKLSQRRPHGVIHHSDHGRQYTVLALGKRCRELGVVPSHGFVGNAYDNAMAESGCATINCKLFNRPSWHSPVKARKRPGGKTKRTTEIHFGQNRQISAEPR